VAVISASNYFTDITYAMHLDVFQPMIPRI